MRALDTNKLKAEIIRQLEYLSEWTDNGECREYSDIDTERATEIADEIIKACGGNTQPDTGSGLHLAGVSVSLLERAYGLVGHPCTNISYGTDSACEQWRSDYERWRNER